MIEECHEKYDGQCRFSVTFDFEYQMLDLMMLVVNRHYRGKPPGICGDPQEARGAVPPYDL